MDLQRVKALEAIAKNIRDLEREVSRLDQYIELYLTNIDELNLRMEDQEGKDLKLKEKYKSYQKKVPKILLYVCSRYNLNLKFKNMRLDQVLYQVRSALKTKAINAKNSPVVEKRKEYKVILKNFSLEKGKLIFPNVASVGKNAPANLKNYKSNRWKNYYHAMVRGGGLVILKKQDHKLGCTLALIFSKNLKYNGKMEGKVSYSKDIIPTEPVGSFYFKDPIYLKALSTLYLKVQLKNGNIYMSLEVEKPKTRDACVYYLMYVPASKGSRFDALRNLNLGISKSLLQRIVPPLYNLELV